MFAFKIIFFALSFAKQNLYKKGENSNYMVKSLQKENVTLGDVVKEVIKVGSEGVGTVALGTATLALAAATSSLVIYPDNSSNSVTMAGIMMGGLMSFSIGSVSYALCMKTIKDYKKLKEYVGCYKNKV
tara:strand:- start:2240 stop:2626 length:387 start_codon:yes stop_codon:yes gene_type:complete